MPRYCFISRVHPAKLEVYRERHAAVWPQMLIALRDSGWRNYSLHLSDDGLLVGYFEADDAAEAQARMDATEVNARWQAEMAELFSGAGAPDAGFVYLPEVFNLEQQLARIDHPPIWSDGNR